MCPTFPPAVSTAQPRTSCPASICALLMVWGLATGFSLPRCSADDGPAAELARRIASENRHERLEAIRDAAQLGPAARSLVPQLIAALESQDLTLRYQTANALGAIGPQADAAVEPLSALLDADLPLLRYAAVTALRQIASADDQQLTERLRKLAGADETLDVRVAAARAVATLASERNSAASPEIIRVLVEGLSNDDDHVISDAIHGLAAAGSGATESIVPLLRATEETTQANAADALAILGLSAQSATPALVKSLDSAAGDSLRNMLRALAAVGGDPQVAIPAILKVLDQQSSDETRITALRALGEFGDDAGSAVPSIVPLIASDDLRLSLEAAETLGAIGPAAAGGVAPLMEALKGEDGLLTITAAQALSHIGAPAVAPLRQLLSQPDYQLLATTILGDIGPDAAPAVPDLVKLIDSENDDVRRAALLALAGVGPAASDAVDELRAALKNPDYPARPGAAYALTRIGDTSAVGDLKQILEQSNDKQLQMTAAWALVMLQPDAEPAERVLPALVEGLDNPWDLVRRECVMALGILGPEAGSATDAVLPLLDDPDPLVQSETLIALQRMGADVEHLLPRLLQGLDEETNNTRYASAFVLGQLGPDARQAIPQLKQLLNHRREFDRVVAAWALAKIDPSPATCEMAVPLIVRGLSHPSSRVRLEAATTLGDLGHKSSEVLEALRTATEDPSADVQQAAQKSLQKLGGA